MLLRCFRLSTGLSLAGFQPWMNSSLQRITLGLQGKGATFSMHKMDAWMSMPLTSEQFQGQNNEFEF